MMDVALTLMSSTVVDHALTGNAPRPRGNAANSRSPSAGTFPTADGLLSLGVNEPAQFARLARALDRNEWLDDPRFATPAARDAHRGALVAAIERALAARTAAQWEANLLANGVPVARVATLPEALSASARGGRPHPLTADGHPSAGRPFRIHPD